MGKGPTRRQGSGKKEPQSSKDAKRASREIHKGMPKGGFQSSPKGDKGYNRKEKHKTDHTVGEELTPLDETYRGVGFPIAELNWATSASEEDDFPPGTSMEEMERQDPSGPIPVKDTPGFPPTKEGGGNVPNKPSAWGSLVEARPCRDGEDPGVGHCNPNSSDEYISNENLIDHIKSPMERKSGPGRYNEPDFYPRTLMGTIAADLSWSTWKQQTFNDDGKKGDVSAWGLKSIIDRGVQPHEKSSGAKRIEDAENQTQKRDIPSKKFKAYSMIGAFDW